MAFGIRHAEKKFNSILKLTHSPKILEQASKFLEHRAQVVRVIFFDKTAAKNWLVSWHQDKTVAVNRKFECQGWKAWTLKDNVHHVQPPVEVLNRMITLRLHLDDATKINGCLKVIPNSHELGILQQQEITQISSQDKPVLCEVEAGDAIIMRPLILHASSKAEEPKHRRVIHIEYSDYNLAEGICWA